MLDEECNANEPKKSLDDSIRDTIEKYKDSSLGDYLRGREDKVFDMLHTEFTERDEQEFKLKECDDVTIAASLKSIKALYPGVSNEELAAPFDLTAEEVQKYLAMNVNLDGINI